jgi:hypothetical protein
MEDLRSDEQKMNGPIYEPELNFLPWRCECGSGFTDEAHLKLHKIETCPRNFDPSFKYPRSPVPRWFELPDAFGVGDGGRKT